MTVKMLQRQPLLFLLTFLGLIFGALSSPSNFDCYDLTINSAIPNATFVVVKTLEGPKYCIHLCTHSRFIFSFDCKAVMVDQQKRECHLSEINRQQKGTTYTAGTDYYEKTCNPLLNKPKSDVSASSRNSYSSTAQRYTTAATRQTPYRYTTRPYVYTTRPYNSYRYTVRPTYTYTTARPYITPRPYTYTTARPYTYTTRPYTTRSYNSYYNNYNRYTTPRPPVYTTRPTTRYTLPPRTTTTSPPRKAISLEELENMESASSEEYADDDYADERRFVKRSADDDDFIIDSSSPVDMYNIRAKGLATIGAKDISTETAPFARPIRTRLDKVNSESEQKYKPILHVGLRELLPISGSSVDTSINLDETTNECFKKEYGRQLKHFGQWSVVTNTLKECAALCLKHSSFFCLSVNYDINSKNCTLNDGSATINQAMLTVASNSIYLENKCLSKQKSEVSKSAPVIQTLPKFQYCFRIRANAILYELKGIVVEEAKTLNDCLLACGQSRRLYHAPCMSLNWFKNTEQCFIHSASSDTKQLQRSTETDFYKNFCSEYDIFGEDKPARTKDLLYDEDVSNSS